MSKRKIIIRADGSQEIGFGHVYRSLALLEMLLEFKETLLFVSHNFPDFIADFLNEHQINSVKVETIQYHFPDYYANGEEINFDMTTIVAKGDLVLLDGYWFGEKYLTQIKKLGGIIGLIDDLGVKNEVADFIINHSPGSTKEMYPKVSRTYLGLEYLILRSSFFSIHTNRLTNGNVLISVGGSDTLHLTEELISIIIRIIKRDDNLQFQILITSNFADNRKTQISYELSKSKLQYKIHENLKAEDLTALMDSCSHAILPSSTIALEAICRRIKPLIFTYSKNQENIYSGIIKKELGFPLIYNKTNHTFDSKMIYSYLKNGNTQQKEVIGQPKVKSTILKYYYENSDNL